jgi:branched-chain amino acid transport system substrate-binding protein
MTKRISTISLIVCLLLVIVALPVITGCTTSPQAKTVQVLKVGIITPTTGPAAEKGSPMGHANLDAINYVNTELGGAGGYRIDVSWYDTSYDASKVVTLVKRLMDEGCLMFTTSASKEMEAAMETANGAEFPGMSCFSSTKMLRPPQHTYGQTPDYSDNWGAFANYYMKNIWKGSGKPKMALHLLNNATGYGARDAAKASADKLGIEIVSIDEHTATTTSEIESLTRIKTKKPDVLFISSTPAPTAVIIKNAKDLGLYPGMTIACGSAGFTKALIDLAGGSTVEGVYGVSATVNWGDNVPGMAKMTEYCQKLHAQDYGNMDYIAAWAQSLVVAEILKIGVKNAGYDVLAKGNVESWRALETSGIRKLKDFDVAGLHGPVSYVSGDNRLSKSLRIFQVKSSALTPISGWTEAPLVKYEEFDWFGK